MNEEIFKDIEGYEGLYEVSNLGNVRSVGRWKKGNGNSSYFQEGRVLKPVKGKKGYLRIGLWKDSKEKKHLVHRLVATAFIPNTENLPEVNHIDENKENNQVSNLEWCTSKYNTNYGTGHQRAAEALRGVYNNPKKSEIILQMTLDYIFVKEWDSISECGRNGFNSGAVSLCCNNKYGSEGNIYKGYRWVKKEDYEKQAA